MNIKKITAAVVAAAVLTVAAPMTGVLPDTLSVAASAAEYKVGDVFYAAFDENGNLVDILYSNSTEMMGDDYLDGLECTVKADGTVSAAYCMEDPTFFRHYNGTLTIPSTIGGYTVSELTTSEYDNFCYSGAKKVVIPETVQTIAQSAFSFSVFLEEVEFSGNSQLKLIDQWAFQDCRSLKSITIPSSVETIAYGAFNNSDQEISVSTVNSPIAEVYGILQKVYFTDTYSLTDVNFAEGSNLKTIGEYAFASQKALTSITFPEGLTIIGRGALAGTSALQSVDLPASVETIGYYAFNPSTSSPDSVLTAINVDEANPYFKSVDGVLYTKDGKTLVDYPAAKSGEFVIPDGVTAIQQGAFQFAQITSLTIPEGVTELSEDAFCACPNLSSVTLPESLTKIGKWAFQGPNKLTSIYIPESVTEIDPQAFEDSSLKNIEGVAGSYAETFANENGYTFNGEGGSSDEEENTFGGEDTEGVQVLAKSEVIPKEAHFQVQIDDSLSSDTRVAFNCFFTYNGAYYEPTDTVTVRIPVPVGMQDIAETLKVYHYQDGKYVQMDVTYEPGTPTSYLVFETDHFSIYVVTAENLDEDSSDNSSTSTESTPTEPDKGNPDTGVAAAATVVGVMAIAGAAVLVVCKKRK